MKKVIEFDEKCQKCNGTGLYVGMAERDGSAVVCHNCKGTGYHHFKHTCEDFSGREVRSEIIGVFEINPGIVIGKGEGNRYSLSDFGGMAYNDWLEGKPFPPASENRKFTYPAWWYQSADSSKKPGWNECIGCGAFSGCEHFDNKEKCWERFDKEQGALTLQPNEANDA